MSWIDDLERQRLNIIDTLTLARSDPSPGVQASVRSLERKLAELEQLLSEAPTPLLELHLAGPPVQDHEIQISALAPLLSELQETISSIGQAVLGRPTASSSIPSNIRRDTALSLRALAPGSVVVELTAAAEDDLFRDSTPRDDSLVLTAVTHLMEVAVLAHRPDDETILDAVALLGPRTYGHLTKLVKSLVENRLDVDLTFRSPTHGMSEASLSVSDSQRFLDVLSRTDLGQETVDVVGRLVGANSFRKRFELQTGDDESFAGQVIESLVDDLGRWFGKTVTATLQVATTEYASGVVQNRYVLVGLSGEEESTGQPYDVRSKSQRSATGELADPSHT